MSSLKKLYSMHLVDHKSIIINAAKTFLVFTYYSVIDSCFYVQLYIIYSCLSYSNNWLEETLSDSNESSIYIVSE